MMLQILRLGSKQKSNMFFKWGQWHCREYFYISCVVQTKVCRSFQGFDIRYKETRATTSAQNIEIQYILFHFYFKHSLSYPDT